MKNLKITLLILSGLISASLFAAEAPLKPTTNESASYIAQLSPDLQRKALLHLFKGGEYPNFNALANAIAAMQNTLSAQALINLFEALPYTANALDLAEKLQDLKIMQDPQIVAWINATKKQLKNGPELFDAAFEDNLERVNDLLTLKNINLNWQDQNRHNRTALLQATRNLHDDIALKLIAAGANPNITDNQINTPLLLAVQHAFQTDLAARVIPLVKALIAAGADLNQSNTDGETALYFAANIRSPQILEMLLASGANPNIRGQVGQLVSDPKNIEYGRPPLVIAVKNNKKEHVVLLLAHGADPNIKLTWGLIKNWTPLLEAIDNRNRDIVELLLKAGADPNYHRNREAFTPLMTAVDQGNIEIVKLLLNAGADPDFALYNGVFARGMASSYRGEVYPKIVKLLDEASAKRKAKQTEKQ